jgi:hypothetical protein
MGGQKFGREIIVEVPGIGVLNAWGTTVPTDGEVGYASACLFQKQGGTDRDTVLYVNVGTLASCNFDAMLGAS